MSVDGSHVGIIMIIFTDFFNENLFQSFGWVQSQTHENERFLAPNLYGMFAVFT